MKFKYPASSLHTKPHQMAQAGLLQRVVIRIFAAPLNAIFGRILMFHYHRGHIRSAELHTLLANTERALWQRESGRYKAAKSSDNSADV